MRKYYELHARFPWGDYGAALINGFAARNGPDAPLRIRRTGPFSPPMFFPWLDEGCSQVVVTGRCLSTLEGLNILKDCEVRPVIKERIIDLDWSQWDLLASSPSVVPPGGEPGDYFLAPHSEMAAAALGDLYQVLPPVVKFKGFRPEKNDSGKTEDVWLVSEFPPYGLFSTGAGLPVVIEDLKEAILGVSPEWVECRHLPIQITE